uniref:Mitochondrial import receptor subunit TOM40B n=1 Tax=Phascolarctos cinereus TaxID=38626 RepID=A0A6P5J9A6_PHACI|nr:mitochondrial import receptor subunit TOM40B [Phascolarctos cinereus]XP_020827699.1 mitochondrial import receptor subunit TOM40B [Phascolarctos cinereus]
MGNMLGLAPPGALPRRSARREEPLPNPGSFDELHRLCKDVFPVQMEGVKFIVNKVLSSHFQVTHTVHMSALGLSGYHLHAAFVGDQQLSSTEVFPTVVGDMDSSGEPQCPGPASRGRAAPSQGSLPDPTGQVPDVAV